MLSFFTELFTRILILGEWKVKGKFLVPIPPGCQDLIRAARAAVNNGEREKALEMWTDSISTFPKNWLASPDGLSVMLDLGRLDEAEEVMRDALTYQPKAPFVLQSRIRIAKLRGEIGEAVKRCYVLWRKSPKNVENVLKVADLLVGLGKPEEAEHILENCVFASHGFVLARRARLAAARHDWIAAERLWDERLAMATVDEMSKLGAAVCYKELGKFEKAEATLFSALQDPAPSVEVWLEKARLSERKEDWPEAVRCWKDVRLRFPRNVEGYLGGARSLMKTGLREDAEAVMDEGRAKLPDDTRRFSTLELG
jgi:tetratricopeptide (TPR) repeat protein